jgi:hypothetical protein
MKTEAEVCWQAVGINPHTEVSLAARFAEKYAHQLRYVHELKSRHRWYIRDESGQWAADRTLRVQRMVVNFCCLEAAGVDGELHQGTIERLLSHQTVVAVELLARCCQRLAATKEDVDIGRKVPTPAQRERARVIFTALLARFARENRRVSDRPGRNYAPRIFAGEREARGAACAVELREAMKALLREGAIVGENVRDPRSHKWVYQLRLSHTDERAGGDIVLQDDTDSSSAAARATAAAEALIARGRGEETKS